MNYGVCVCVRSRNWFPVIACDTRFVFIGVVVKPFLMLDLCSCCFFVLARHFHDFYKGMDYQGGGFGGGGGTPMMMGGGASQSPPVSSSGGRGGRTRRSADEQTVQPVTISMIQSAAAPSGSDDDGLQLADGRKLYHVKIVGAARSLEHFSTNCIYNIEDGTGLMEVKQWADANNECQAIQDLRNACSKDNIYLACTGQVKDYDGKKMIVAESVRPIATGNEIAYHMLEVVYQAEQAKRQNLYVQPVAPGMQGIGFGGPAMGGAPIRSQQYQQSYGAGGGGGGVRDAVLTFIKLEGDKTEAGANVQQCIRSLMGQYSEGEILQTLDNLAQEGHIYSSIDEHHYKF
jgi:replication factor A2